MEERPVYYICGARGTRPVSGREFLQYGGSTICNVIKYKDYAIIIDCGTGFANAVKLVQDCKDIDIILTHMHYDHILGLLEYDSLPKTAEVRIFSSFDKWYGNQTLAKFMGAPFWPYTPDFKNLISVNPPCRVDLKRGAQFNAILSTHPDEALIVKIKICGTVICFTCDFEHGRISIAEWVKGSDILIYDGTFTHEEYPNYMGWGHSTWKDGCAHARDSEIPKLIITHHSPDYTDDMLEAQEKMAEDAFSGASFAKEGTKIIL